MLNFGYHLTKLTSMRVIEITYKKPANLLIEALQKHCSALMAEPEIYGITTLKDIENKIWEHAKTQQGSFPRCSLDNLEVILNRTITSEWYNLLYRGEHTMISIFARPDAYADCFLELDNNRKLN